MKTVSHPATTFSGRRKRSIWDLTRKLKEIVFLFVLLFGLVPGTSFALVVCRGGNPRCGGGGGGGSPPHGILQFSSEHYFVSEGAGILVLHVTRVNGVSGSIGVAYNPVDSTAQQPSDYSLPSGTLSWIDGDNTHKTITVMIADNNVHEPNKEFMVELSQPSGGAVLGANRTATVTITDDDPGSADSDLSGLALSAGAISPNFSPSTNSYTLTVPNLTTSTTVTATLNDSNSTMTINGSPATSGAAFGPITLNPGNNYISILVTAEDQTATEYIVVVHRIPIVTSMSDSGAGTLRQALADAGDGDTINFVLPLQSVQDSPAVANVITLTSGELVVNNDITISGPGASSLEVTRDISGSNFRIFNVAPNHTVTIQGLTISNGVAQGSYPDNCGGGIYNDHSFLNVNRCDLHDNGAALGGGGIFSTGDDNVPTGASLILSNSSLRDNESNLGGGLFNMGETGTAALLVINSTFSGNSALSVETGGGFGGGLFNDGESGTATLSINNSTFSGNSALLAGGGIFNDGSTGNVGLTVSNSTFHKNTAPFGGAIQNDGSHGGSATTDIGNTILLTSPGGSDIGNSSGTITSHGYNLSSAGGAGVLISTGDQINTDPMLGPLKDNGGPTLTHAPLINSSAIDQGKRDAIPALTTNFDQRGSDRPVDDAAVIDAAGGDGSDIGAVEIGSFVHPLSANSWKMHGAAGSFPINMPLTGPVGIECRSGGAAGDYQLVIVFAQPITISGAAVTSGIGSVSGVSITGANHLTRPNGVPGNNLIINLTGVTNVQRLTVGIFDTNEGSNTADVGVRMGVLIGDTTQSGEVNASDISDVKAKSGLTVDASTFYEDVTANGAINSSDVSVSKFKSGTALP